MGDRSVGGCPDIALMMQLLPQLVPCPGHVLVALQPGERRPRIVRHSIATLQLTPSRIVEIEHCHANGLSDIAGMPRLPLAFSLAFEVDMSPGIEPLLNERPTRRRR